MWNPQQYRVAGIEQGIPSDSIEAAIVQAEAVIRRVPSLPAILTLKHLSLRAQVDYRILRGIVEREQESYRSFVLKKRSGGWRQINIPSPLLMRTQKWIAVHVLRDQPVHQDSFAFAPDSSIVKCANRHTGAKWLVKMDITDFFGSINELQAFRVFRTLGYQPLVCFELARICTYLPRKSRRYSQRSWVVWRKHPTISAYQQKYFGRLAQGAPTSPMLSNLFMYKLDEQIAALALSSGLTYTRYSDDLTFSTRNDFDRRRATELVSNVSKVLRRAGLSPNAKKTVIVPPGARKVVLGLLVDGASPRLSREFKNKLRQHLYFLESVGPFKHASVREFESVGGLYRHVRGLIDFSNMIEPVYAAELLRRFLAIAWPNAGPNNQAQTTNSFCGPQR